MQLNPDQQRVVDSDGHCLVVACPGSGKTRVITTKIGALLKRHERARICAVTFTRDAAGELTHRVIQEVGDALFKSACRIGTFHSLAIRQLRNHNKLGKVASPLEQVTFLKRAIALGEPGMEYEEATAIVEKAKGALGSVPEQDHPIYRAYTKLLASHKVCDLYDVIRDSVKMMKSKEINPYPVQFMLVDEFQDTDNIQLEWVLEHARAGSNITVVGDDDQSIYGWRGALGYGGMQTFMHETGAEKITLGVNYRCFEEILSSADKLIQHNGARIDKALVAGRGKGGSVKAQRAGSRLHEAEQVAELIQSDCIPLTNPGPLFRYTVPTGSWAVLARNRRLLDPIEEQLQARGIQYYRPPKESFWSRAPQSLMLSLLSALDGGNTGGIDHALNHGLVVKVGKSRAADAIKIVHDQFDGGFGALMQDASISTGSLMADEGAFIMDFASKLKGWYSQVQEGRFNFAIRAVASWFAALEDGEAQKERAVSAGSTLCKLQGTITMRVNAITSLNNSKERPQGVQLQTMHGSKGLEFDNVWIVGTESTTCPSPKSPDHEEERRLMYVAMTRAKNNLIMSSEMSSDPSPFVLESGHFPSAKPS